MISRYKPFTTLKNIIIEKNITLFSNSLGLYNSLLIFLLKFANLHFILCVTWLSLISHIEYQSPFLGHSNSHRITITTIQALFCYPFQHSTPHFPLPPSSSPSTAKPVDQSASQSAISNHNEPIISATHIFHHSTPSLTTTDIHGRCVGLEYKTNSK